MEAMCGGIKEKRMSDKLVSGKLENIPVTNHKFEVVAGIELRYFTQKRK